MKQPSPPPPDPKMEAIKAKAQVDQQKAQIDMQKAEHKMQLDGAVEERKMAMEAAQLFMNKHPHTHVILGNIPFFGE
jgi:ElaB/YqjD/DUF883 family membrane-anchored ribosome-binding protein